MADTIDLVQRPEQPNQPDQPNPDPPPPPPAHQPPPPGTTVVDTMPPAIPVDEPPPPVEGCFSKRSGLEKCLIILVIIILIIAFAMIIFFLIYYFFFSPPEGTCLTDGCVKSASRLKDHMDNDFDPCNNFYDYACGGWSKKQVLGPYQKKVDMESQLKREHPMRLKAVLDADIGKIEPEYSQKAKKFYRSCTNVAKLDERGVSPFMDVVKTVGKFPTLDPSWNSSNGDFNLQKMLTTLARMSITPLFDIHAEPSNLDFKGGKLLSLSDGQLALGTKNAYTGPRDSRKLSGYHEWMVNTLVLLGADRQVAEEDVEEVIDFEIQLAERRRDEEIKANLKLSLNLVNIISLNDDYPWLNWVDFIQGAGVSVYIGEKEMIDVREHSYMNRLEDLLDSTPNRVVANYLMTRLLPLTAHLGSDFIREHDKYLKDVLEKEREDRWKFCAVSAAKLYHDSVTRMFVERYFNKEAKNNVTQIVDDVMTVFRDRIIHNSWMTGQTRKHALIKLERLTTKIGYPDSFDSDESPEDLYSTVTADQGKYMENCVSLMMFEAAKKFKLSEKDDEDKWNVSPISLHSLYDVEKNELVLPAGFLQTPIYDSKFSNAMNYAGVGSTVGREIIEGFDQTGRLYDSEGKLKDWWKKADGSGFNTGQACFKKQWACNDWEGDRMDVSQALAEIVAYNAGLMHSYEAYRAMIARRGTEEQRLPSLRMHNNQVFFLSYAQLWCAKYGLEARKEFIKSSTHPPFPYRVFGTLQNSKPFAKTFDCPVGTRMNPRDKCDMW